METQLHGHTHTHTRTAAPLALSGFITHSGNVTFQEKYISSPSTSLAELLRDWFSLCLRGVGGVCATLCTMPHNQKQVER